MRTSHRGWVCLALVLALAAPAAAGAAIVQVDDDSVECPRAAHATITAAVAAAVATDTVEVCPGTYAEPTIVIDKALTIDGLDRDTTLVESTGTSAFRVEASDVTFSDLTLRPGSGSEGVRYELAAGTLTNQLVDNVVFSGFTGEGIEVHGPITVEDLTVRNSVFTENQSGVRMSSTSVVDGFDVTDSTFSSSLAFAIGIYQANDGGTSTLTDLQVTGSTFTGLGLAGLFLEEVRSSVIQDNDFTGNHTGVLVFKNYATSGVPVEGLQILDNDFTDHTRRAVWFWSLLTPVGPGVRVAGNGIEQDVGALTGDGQGMIQVHLASGLAHEQVEVSGNSVTFSGLFDTATTAFALLLSGDGPVLVERNLFDGGGVPDGGGSPPFAGVYIRSDDASMGPRAAAPVDLVCNDILDFVHGVTVYDAVAAGPGGLAPGASVSIETTNIVGNSGFGVFNGGTSESILAGQNWWGDASGPGGEGPGTGDAISENVSVPSFFAAELVDCAPALSVIEVPAAGATGLALLGLLLALAGALAVTRLGR